MSDVIGRLRAVCMAFPEVTEEPFGGHTSPCWRVRDKLFVMVNEAQTELNLKAPPGAQAVLVESNPERFFVPKYVGAKGWVGMRLDVALDWDEVEALAADSYRLIAPKRLAAMV